VSHIYENLVEEGKVWTWCYIPVPTVVRVKVKQSHNIPMEVKGGEAV
jgi:hypothetical protein